MSENPQISGIESRRHSPRYTLIQARTKDLIPNALLKEWNSVLKEERKLLTQQKRLTAKQRELTAAKKAVAARKKALSVKVKKAEAKAKARLGTKAISTRRLRR